MRSPAWSPLQRAIAGNVLALAVAAGALLPAQALAASPPAQARVAAAAGDDIAVEVNGRPVSFPDARPIIRNDRTLVPVRAIAEALGAQVQWDPESRTALITLGQRRVRLTVDSPLAYVNLRIVALEVPATIHQERILVPLRFVSEGLGARVDWDAASRTVRIVLRTLPQDPEALALLQRLKGADQADYTGTLNMRMTLAPGAGVAFQGELSGSVRGQDFLQRMTLSTSMAPQAITVEQAYRQGQFWMRQGEGPWHKANLPSGARPGQILPDLQDPERYGVALGQQRSDGGRTLQELILTVDPSLFRDALGALGTPAAGPEVQVELTTAQVLLTVDVEKSEVVAARMNLAGKMAVSQAGVRQEWQLEVQMDLRLTPAQGPIAWPADLP